MSSTFEMAKNVRRIILMRAAEVMSYHSWSDEFSLRQIKEIPEKITGYDWFKKIDPSDLTEEEMRSLGFAKWVEESPAFLIPFWLLLFLSDEIVCVSLTGKIFRKKREEMDNDHRSGFLAYAVIPKV